MDPFTALALAQVAGKVVGNVGEGVTRAANARQYYTKEDEQRRKQLEAMKKSGDMGLSQAEEAAIEQQFGVQRGGAMRSAQAQGLQQAAILGNAGSLSGRDLFLQQMAQEEADQRLRAVQAGTTAQANLAAAQRQNAELKDLIAGEQKMKAERRAGIIQTVTGAAQAGAAAAQPSLERKVQAEQMRQQEEYAKRMRDYGYTPEETTRMAYAYNWK
jgi:hypothetical protein